MMSRRGSSQCGCVHRCHLFRLGDFVFFSKVDRNLGFGEYHGFAHLSPVMLGGDGMDADFYCVLRPSAGGRSAG